MTESTQFVKRTGYAMADRPLAYDTTEKFSSKCFQRKLRESYEVERTLSLTESRIERISFKDAQQFILQYEWLGTMGATQLSYGLFCEDQLAAVSCLGVTAGTGVTSEPFGKEYKSKGIIYLRGACSPNAHQHTATFMLGLVKRELAKIGYNFVIAYADPEAGEIGTIYQADNWKFYGFTSGITYLIRPDGKRVDPRIVYKYAKKNELTRQEQMQIFFDEGYTLEKSSPKLKYLCMFGSRGRCRSMMKSVRVRFYPYLKREIGMKNLYSYWKNEYNIGGSK